MNISKNYFNRSQTLHARIFRRIIYLLIFLSILVGILVFAPQVLADELDNVKASGVMRVGTDATYPPFEFADDKTGEIVGFDVDLMKAIGERLGVKADFVVVPFDAIISGLNSGKYDCVISSMTMVVVTHEVGFAREVADRVIFFEGGKILGSGPTQEILNSAKHPRTIEFLSKVLK